MTSTVPSPTSLEGGRPSMRVMPISAEKVHRVAGTADIGNRRFGTQ
jgi:hypothetical protein